MVKMDDVVRLLEKRQCTNRIAMVSNAYNAIDTTNDNVVRIPEEINRKYNEIIKLLEETIVMESRYLDSLNE